MFAVAVRMGSEGEIWLRAYGGSTELTGWSELEQ